MAGVGNEQPLAVEGCVEAAEHLVKGVGQFTQLVVRTAQIDALVEGLGRQRSGGLGEPGDGTKRLLGQQVAAGRANDDDDPEEDQAGVQQVSVGAGLRLTGDLAPVRGAGAPPHDFSDRFQTA